MLLSMAVPWLLSPEALAQICNSSSGWNSYHVFAGSAGSDIPVAVSLRAWGPTNEVFLTYERRFPNETDMPHRVYLKGYTCNPATCGAGNVTNTYAQSQITPTIYHDQYANPSTAIDVSSGGARKIALVSRSRRRIGCDGDSTNYTSEIPGDPEARRLDLYEVQWYSNGDPSDGFDVELDPTGDTLCTDRGMPYARYHESYGLTRACWRWDDDKPTSGVKHQVRCGRRNSDGSYSVTTLDNTDPAVSGIKVDQNEASFDLTGSSDTRLVVHRSNEGNQGVIRIRYPDDAGTEPVITLSSNDPGMPDITQSSTGVWHIVWHESYGTNSVIKHAWCEQLFGSSCRTLNSWTTEVVEDDGTDLRNPQVNTDGKRVFIVYMADPDNNGQYRIQYKTRCQGSGTPASWENSITAQTPCLPTTAAHDQSLLLGRPSTGVDRGSNVFHVGYLQVDALDALGRHNDGDVVWSATGTYSECL